MKLDRYYYLTSLPSLGSPGMTPPLSFAELLEQVEDDRDRQTLIGSLFLQDDLLQREAHLAGELAEPDPAVLSVQQIRDESPLPGYLALESDAATDVSRALLSDRLWEQYFRYAHQVGQRLNSRFLQTWVGYEVGLRNALAATRAKRLELDPADYLVARDLAADQEDFDQVVAEWAAAPTPLAGQQVLLRARWEWVEQHDAYFSFRDDELAAYAVRLMLLHQWQRVTAVE